MGENLGMIKHKTDCEMAFGRKDKSCPRCQELLKGATPRKGWQTGFFTQREQEAKQRSAAIKAHFAPGGKHDRGECGPVCTAFDW